MFIFLMALLGTLVFSIGDYYGFNTLGQKLEQSISISYKTKKYTITYYRILQTIFQFLLCWVLGQIAGWQCWITFIFLWWTFLCDIEYYGWCESIRKFKSEVGSFKRDFLQLPVITWGWWTPYGLYLWLRKKEHPISGIVLLIQSALALFISYEMLH